MPTEWGIRHSFSALEDGLDFLASSVLIWQCKVKPPYIAPNRHSQQGPLPWGWALQGWYHEESEVRFSNKGNGAAKGEWSSKANLNLTSCIILTWSHRTSLTAGKNPPSCKGLWVITFWVGAGVADPTYFLEDYRLYSFNHLIWTSAQAKRECLLELGSLYFLISKVYV